MGMHLMGMHLIGVHPTGYLISVHLMGAYLISLYLMGVCLVGVRLKVMYFMRVHLMGASLPRHPPRARGHPNSPPNSLARDKLSPLSLPDSEIDIETLVFGFTITFDAVIPVPSPLTRFLIFFVIFFSLPPVVSLAGVVDGGGAERAVNGASGEGDRQASRARPGAG
jgi:hypothetical protein